MSLYLVRHGETAWSLSGQHTGRTDIPLTARGEGEARRLAGLLGAVGFSRVVTSPRRRARRTCELVGFGGVAQVEPDLAEWDYGEYEGLRSNEIQQRRPGWSLFRDGCPRGESPLDVSDRADRLIVEYRSIDGKVAIFSHGHFGRVLAARWIGLPVRQAEHLVLSTASVSILAYEHDRPDPDEAAIVLWNAVPDSLAVAPPGTSFQP